MSNTVLSTDVHKNSSSDYKNAQIQELNDVKEFLKISHNKYLKYKILYDAVQECAANSHNLDDELKMKVQDVLLDHRCAQVLPIESEGFSEDSSKLLGISHLNISELDYSESMKLRKSIVLTLQSKYKNICQQFSKITNQDIYDVPAVSTDFLDFNLNSDDHVLLEFKRKLADQQQQYIQNLLTEQDILKDITNLRLEKLPEVYSEKVKECEIKTHMNALRIKIVQEKTRIDIFMETNNSLRAYEEVMKDIKEQQEECQSNIEHLQKLKARYNQVSCKQFNDILKSYVQYKSSLEKKKMIYDSIKS